LSTEVKSKHGLKATDETFHGLNATVLALLGAGPGLTPSGDDLLAGVMLVLHRLQRADLSNELWQVLQPQLQYRTHAISAAHLRMAARGQCSEPILRLLECLVLEPDCQQSETVLLDCAQFDCAQAATAQSATAQSETVQSENARATANKIRMLASRVGSSSGWDTLAGMSLVLLAL